MNAPLQKPLLNPKTHRKPKSVPITHTVRTSSNKRLTVKLTRGLAIKLMCMECLGWECNPKECVSTLCPLFPYRGRTLKSKDD